MTQVIAGVKIPDSTSAREAAELVHQYENEMLFNRSVVSVAALFHDLGLVNHFHTQTKLFEVDGAAAAREFLEGYGIR